MKRFGSAMGAPATAGNSVIFRAAAYCAFFTVILCGGCSDNGIGTAVGESKIPPAPPALSSVSATAASSSSITVAWPPVSSAAGYNVYSGASAYGDYIKVGGTASASYTNTELASGTIYYYKVSAYNSGGESPLSSYTFAATIPGAPANVSASAAAPDHITLSWPPVFGAAGYIVYRGANADGAYSKAGTVSSASYTDIGLSSGEVYYYKVSAYNSGGESTLSSYASAATVPGAPVNVSASAATPGNIIVSWSATSGAAGYIVYRGTSADGHYDSVYTTPNTLYTNTGLSSGETYYYKVSAYNGAGESPKSQYVKAAAVITDVPVVSAVATASDGITVSWSSVSGAIGYYVYRATNADGPYDKVETTSSTSYTNAGLSPGATYYYKVSAYNSTGEGARSPYASAMTAPNPPSGISAIAASSSGVTVSWFSVSQAIGYNVYRSTSPYGVYSKVTATSATSYTNTGLSPCTTYYFKVSAYNDGGESAQSSSYADASPTLPEQKILAEPVSSSAIAVSWPSICGADGYYVLRSENGETGNYSQVRATSATSYKDDGLSPGKTYCYKISAANGGAISSPACAVPASLYTPGEFTDDRDGKTYTTVTIEGNMTWMAENLNYETPSGSRCYNNNESQCDAYGRLYDWEAAADAYGYGGDPDDDANRQGVCPDGWHLPSRKEWGDLAKAAGGGGTYGADGAAGTKLKSAAGWNVVSGVPSGTDIYGFSALPGGYVNSGESSSGVGASGYWWTASEGGSGAYYRIMRSNDESVGETTGNKGSWMSVRCVQE